MLPADSANQSVALPHSLAPPLPPRPAQVVAVLVLLQAVLVAPPSRQPTWDFVQHQTKRLKFWVRKVGLFPS